MRVTGSGRDVWGNERGVRAAWRCRVAVEGEAGALALVRKGALGLGNDPGVACPRGSRVVMEALERGGLKSSSDQQGQRADEARGARIIASPFVP